MSQTAPPRAARQGQPGERLDTILRTTSPRGWWALVVIAAIVVVAVIWACVATVPEQLSYTATVNANVYTRQVSAPVAGQLTQAVDHVGSEVTKGQPVATITTSDGKSVAVPAPETGTIDGIQVQEGEWLDIGTELGRILVAPDLSRGVSIVGYLPFSSLAKLPMGSDVSVTITDPTSNRTYTVAGTVTDIGPTPASKETMFNTSQSTGLVEKWISDSDGTAYAVAITVSNWDTQTAGFTPVGGQVTSVLRTYLVLHPIQILFGG